MVEKEIKKVLITFSINGKTFKSAYEKNIFYRGLYGWKQIVKKQSGIYKYEKGGLLNQIPHEKVDNSIFIIDKGNEEAIRDYFKQWHNKVMFQMFEVVREMQEEREKMRKRMRMIMDE